LVAGIVSNHRLSAWVRSASRGIGRGITPIRRWGKPEDIGRAVRANAEDRFPFTTGASFDVDGGFYL
jgi:NAD(P)-dependent dehydrogenase (short-subunit alcohol dehydrogenase family)